MNKVTKNPQEIKETMLLHIIVAHGGYTLNQCSIVP